MNKIILKTTLNSGVELLQDSKSKMLNVTALFDSANKQLNLNRRVEDWVKSPKTTELFEYRKSLKISHSEKLGETDNQSLTKQQEKEIENQILKVTKSRQTKDGWIKGKVVADEVMGLDAASYLDVALKNEIYEYYLDDKAKVRNKMTEDYKKLCSVISRNISSESETFRSVCHHINGIVFDKFISNLWNNDCTKEQYTELDDIMIKLIGLIEDGYVDTLTKLYKKLEEWYEKKWKHSMFSEIKC